MDRDITEFNSSAAKLTSQPPPPHIPAAFPSESESDHPSQIAPTIPPIWTKYIDSRLKQFCSR